MLFCIDVIVPLSVYWKGSAALYNFHICNLFFYEVAFLTNLSEARAIMFLTFLSASRIETQPALQQIRLQPDSTHSCMKQEKGACQVSDAANSNQALGTQCSLAGTLLKATKTKNIKLPMSRPGVTS